MKNVAIIGLAALLLFSLSATLSLWLNAPTPAERKKPDEENAKVVPKHEPETRAHEEDASARQRDVPGPVIPAAGSLPPNPEEAAQLLSRLRERAATLDRREAELKRREEQAKLIMEEIRGERAVLDALRKQIADELKAMGEKLSQLERRATDLEDQKSKLDKAQTEAQKRQVSIERVESKNLDRMATISDNMAPEVAALIIKQLADSGSMDTAVKLLAQMKERRAAAVLGEMNDAPLAAQLLERLRGLRRLASVPATSN